LGRLGRCEVGEGDEVEDCALASRQLLQRLREPGQAPLCVERLSDAFVLLGLVERRRRSHPQAEPHAPPVAASLMAHDALRDAHDPGEHVGAPSRSARRNLADDPAGRIAPEDPRSERARGVQSTP
jgi:hypothetical protein